MRTLNGPTAGDLSTYCRMFSWIIVWRFFTDFVAEIL